MAYVKCIRNLISSTVPDGKTVTPTDDISIWLACGGRSETYTTLSQVLADSTCLSALINDNNAVDYLVRSTTWAGITLVPNMTSATTPSGEVVADTLTISGREAYKAFDGDSSTSGASGYNVGSYLGYVFPTTHYIQKIKGNLVSATSATFSQNVKFQKTVDGTIWTDIPNSTVTISSSNNNVALNITVDDIVKGIRGIVVSYTGDTSRISFTELILCAGDLPDNATAMSYIGLNNYASNTLLADSTWCSAIWASDYKESVLNVKVPIMTSDNTPSGVVFYKSQYSTTTRAGWYAFDGNTSNQAWSAANDTTNWYVGYDFGSSVKCIGFALAPSNSSSNNTLNTYKIQGSTDNSTWTDLTETLTAPLDINILKEYPFTKNMSNYRYYRLLELSIGTQQSSTKYVIVAELQFYGRADI